MNECRDCSPHTHTQDGTVPTVCILCFFLALPPTTTWKKREGAEEREVEGGWTRLCTQFYQRPPDPSLSLSSTFLPLVFSFFLSISLCATRFLFPSVFRSSAPPLAGLADVCSPSFAKERKRKRKTGLSSPHAASPHTALPPRF